MKLQNNIKFLIFILIMSSIEIFLFNNCFINFNTNIRISNGKFNEYIINKNINDELFNFNDIKFIYENKKINIKKSNIKLSNIRHNIINASKKTRIKAMHFAYNNGFSKYEAIKYSFPEIIETIDKIEKDAYIEPKSNILKVFPNTGNIYEEKPSFGYMINKDAVINDIYNNIEYRDIYYIYNKEIKPIINNTEKYNKLRGTYTTYFNSSNNQRKNNIKQALKCFDGLIINSGESLSFNKTTGVRNQDNGYQKAKIIQNGTFKEEYGGGVCQVSTTLYNAWLMSDLDVIEVNPHSLPVSYIEPCFDAMVNTGSSDLIIKNNSPYPVIIATKFSDDSCTFNIYGSPNNLKIVRRSEKKEELLQFDKEVTNNYKEYGYMEPLKEGESKIISSGKPGYKAISWLEYYSDDILIKTKKLRENTYMPTKEIVLVN